jgi:ribosomal protein S18 acetylase RimI-like enzyme
MMAAAMEIQLRKCTLADLASLAALGRQTYETTFKAFNTPENMAAYLDEAFDLDKLAGELADPGSEFYFLHVDGALAGYLKVNEGGAQTDLREPDGFEIERIYVDAGRQRLGLGKFLIDAALELARVKHKRYVWLGVWERNANALAFYRHMGFYKIGEHAFVMGTDRQTDAILRLDLQA